MEKNHRCPFATGKRCLPSHIGKSVHDSLDEINVPGFDALSDVRESGSGRRLKAGSSLRVWVSISIPRRRRWSAFPKADVEVDLFDGHLQQFLDNLLETHNIFYRSLLQQIDPEPKRSSVI